MPLRHRITALISLTCLGLVAGSAVAQPFGVRQLGPNPDNKDPQQGVYVRDSAVAIEPKMPPSETPV